MHFYTMLGLIPLVAFVGYMNLFVGPAKLVEIPEGYEPKEWEYYENPVTRVLVKYFATPHQEQYEKSLHHLYTRAERRMLE